MNKDSYITLKSLNMLCKKQQYPTTFHLNILLSHLIMERRNVFAFFNVFVHVFIILQCYVD